MDYFLHLNMDFFDFHHHHFNYKNGIYNLDFSTPIFEQNFSVGLHPKDIDENWKINIKKIEEISQHQRCIAIGECGLDAMVSSSLPLQEEVFYAHISIAEALKKPVVIHCVRKFQELMPFKRKSTIPMVVHGFNKKESVGKMLLEQGFYLSFGKALLNHLSLQNFLKEVSLDQIFLETDDAEFNIEDLYELTASLKKMPVEKLQECIWENYLRITDL